MDTVELQWPAKLSVITKGRRGFGGSQHRAPLKFTPLAHWEKTEEDLTALDKTLGPVSPKKEAQALVLQLPENAKDALESELKLVPAPPTKAPRRKRKAKVDPDPQAPGASASPRPVSIFAKKSLKSP